MINKDLGMDIFALSLMVFLVTTGVLMINIQTESVKTELVRIQLSQGDSEGDKAAGVPEYVILSARKTDKGGQLYIENKPISFDHLKQALTTYRQKGKTVLITRFDKALSHGEYVAILDAAKQAGIQAIYDTYEKAKTP
ncbi:MAG: biopolymer transporter ExbD [Thermodesulfobacteriota bacterium]